MKKLLFLLLSITTSMSVLAACGGDETPTTPDRTTVFYTVTFKQAGEEDVVRVVEEGDSLLSSSIPELNQKTGYTVAWDTNDFTNIDGDMIVTAVATANEYTITFDPGEGGSVDPTTQTVTYDAIPSAFPVPTKTDYEFICWMTADNTAVLATNPWTIASDVTLKAKWGKELAVTFVQNGRVVETVPVNRGQTLTEADFPTYNERTGYTVSWNTEGISLENIQQSIVISAKEVPNEYDLTFNANGGSVGTSTAKITYDSLLKDFEFPTPTHEEYEFIGWALPGGAVLDTASETARWTVAKATTLTAVWAKAYTITFDLNGGNLPEGYETTKTVYYGMEYSLPTPNWGDPKEADYSFVCWKHGDKNVPLKGVWTIEEDVTLKAAKSSNWSDWY